VRIILFQRHLSKGECFVFPGRGTLPLRILRASAGGEERGHPAVHRPWPGRCATPELIKGSVLWVIGLKEKVGTFILSSFEREWTLILEWFGSGCDLLLWEGKGGGKKGLWKEKNKKKKGGLGDVDEEKEKGNRNGQYVPDVGADGAGGIKI